MSNAIENSWKHLASKLTASDRDAVIEAHGLSSAEVHVLSTLPGLVSLHFGNGALVWGNAAFIELFAKSSQTAHENSYFDGMNPQDKVTVLNGFADALESGREIQASFKRQTTDEYKHTLSHEFEMQCRAYDSPSQTTSNLILVTTKDVTKHTKKIVDLQVQLREAHEESDEKNRFFASMSHELRTPLNAIIGFSELLEGKAAIRLDDAKKLEYAGLVSQSATHLLSLINDILDLSKLDAGCQERDNSEVDLGEVLDSTARSMLPLAMAKQIALEVDGCEDIPKINSDSRALRQIFTNLISNALKFSPEGKSVEVKVTRLRSRIKITVTDHGIGMDADTLSKLGKVFYQSDDTIRGEYGGSGLGLSIVHKLI